MLLGKNIYNDILNNINRGVRQGCGTSPLLFIIYSNALITDRGKLCRGRYQFQEITLWTHVLM